MASVTLAGLRKQYEDGFVAVHGVDLEIADGEFVVLVGPSGCGKSTTLRMIAGLEEITDGDIRIGGEVVNDVPPKDRDIAMVFQSYALYPHMTVFENVAFGLTLRRMPKPEIDTRVREAAEILGITSILDKKPKSLSGGQRQRVAVGRAIVRKPQVFLFDEPLSNLDAKMRVQMRAEISRLHRQLGATMIYVTHDQVEAMTMGDRIVVLDAGRVQQIDTPLALYEHPVNIFVAGFLGSPAMNFVPGVVQGGNGLRVVADGGSLTVPLGTASERRLDTFVGKRVILGIRPEHLLPAGSGMAGSFSAPMRFELDLKELMGNEIILHAHAGAHSVVARMAPRTLPEPGEPIDLVADLAHLHVFDAESGASIVNSH